MPRFVYIPGDAARVKLDRQYDVITLLSTLEHCGVGDHYGGEPASDDAAVVANLRRFLSPRGRFICSVPFGKPKTMDFFRVYDEARLLSLFGRLEDARYYRFDEVTWYPCAKEDATSWEATQWVERIVVFETSPAPG